MDAHRRARRRQQAADLLLLRRQGRALPRGARADLRRHPRRRAASCTSRRVDPVEAVRRLVAFTWNYYLAHPEFLTLLNSENLHRARHLQALEADPGDELAADRRRSATCSSAAGANGVFRGGVDPVQLYISIAGLAYFYLSNNHTLSAIFGRDLMAPAAHAARLRT